MVKINDNHFEYDGLPNLFSVLLLSIGGVVALLLGIKLRWFRYRMNLEETPPPLFRAHSTAEIRENCSTGTYRQSLTFEDSSIPLNHSRSNAIPSSTSSSSLNNVKSKSSDRESIFRWPFKNKFTLSKQTSLMGDNTVSTIQQSSSSDHTSERKSQDIETLQKNERIKRSISDRLYSRQSVSMPDLVQCDEINVLYRERSVDEAIHKQISQPVINIQKGIEESLDDDATHYQTVDEIKEFRVVTRPIRAKIKLTSVIAENEKQMENVKNDKKEEKLLTSTSMIVEEKKELEHVITEEEKEEKLPPPKPPTPLRRRSRSNSLKDSQQSNAPVIAVRSSIIQKDIENDSPATPPVALPRKKHLNSNIKKEEITELNTAREEINFKSVYVETKIADGVDVETIKEMKITSENNELIVAEIKKEVPEIEVHHVEESATPKSILKTSEARRPSNNHITFIDVPDSSSSSEDEGENDIWSQINLHRERLNRRFEAADSNSDTSSFTENPPPLPFTPPPTAEIRERDFSFA